METSRKEQGLTRGNLTSSEGVMRRGTTEGARLGESALATEDRAGMISGIVLNTRMKLRTGVFWMMMKHGARMLICAT